MSISFNKKWCIVGSVFTIGLMASFVWNNQSKNTNIPISEIRGTFAIDYDNLNAVVGDADYVFVGKVVTEEGTIYKDSVMIEDKDGKDVEISSPYTNYTVSVIENIKGNLTTETPINIQKFGGLSKDKSEYFIYEGDELPIVDDTYIFYVYAQPDGSLLASGPVSNTPINTKRTRDLSSDDEYQDVLEAVENQELTQRKRFKSSYEVESNN